MNMFHSFQPLYAVTGFIVGMLVGLTGVGGGSLMTPLLILLFGVQPATAVGTDLLYAAATKTAGSAVHGLSGTVDWKIVRRLAAGSVPATVLTVALLSFVNLKSVVARDFITMVLAVALLLTALSLIFRERIVSLYAAPLARLKPHQIARLTVALGVVLGALVSISSVGAGAIGVTALVVLYPDLPTTKIVGSDIAHAVPLTLAAGLGHWFLGSIDWSIFASLLVGSIPGILIGSSIAVRLPEQALRFVLAATLLLVAAKLSGGLQAVAVR